MKNLNNLLNENLNENYDTLKSSENLPLLAGIDYNGDSGVIIGGVFKANNKFGRKQAEQYIKRLNINIGFTIEDALSEDSITESDDVCYFIHNNDRN